MPKKKISKGKQDNNVVPLSRVPSVPEAEKIIRHLVKEGKISFSKHARQRMRQREVTTPQILNCLSKGRITEPPFFSYENGGGYETRVERGTAGDWLRVVVCLKLSQNLLIISVIDEE